VRLTKRHSSRMDWARTLCNKIIKGNTPWNATLDSGNMSRNQTPPVTPVIKANNGSANTRLQETRINILARLRLSTSISSLPLHLPACMLLIHLPTRDTILISQQHLVHIDSLAFPSTCFYIFFDLCNIVHNLDVLQASYHAMVGYRGQRADTACDYPARLAKTKSSICQGATKSHSSQLPVPSAALDARHLRSLRMLAQSSVNMQAVHTIEVT
jgi:hypothetical protein